MSENAIVFKSTESFTNWEPSMELRLVREPPTSAGYAPLVPKLQQKWYGKVFEHGIAVRIDEEWRDVEIVDGETQ